MIEVKHIETREDGEVTETYFTIQNITSHGSSSSMKMNITISPEEAQELLQKLGEKLK